MNALTLARDMHDAYAAKRKEIRNENVPPFDALPDAERAAWEAAAQVAIGEVRVATMQTDPA